MLRFRRAIVALAFLFVASVVFIPVQTPRLVFAAAGNITQNTINAVGQLTQIFVPARGCVKLTVGGTFVGTLSFKLSQDGGTTFSAVNLQNCATGSVTDQLTTATGVWLYQPGDGNDGILQVSCTAYTSGSMIVSLVDMVQAPVNMDLAVTTGTTTSSNPSNTNAQVNRCWRGAIVTCVLSAYTSGSITFAFQYFDVAQSSGAGAWVTAQTGTALTATGTTQFSVGLGSAGFSKDVGSQLPTQWRIQVAGATGSMTYSVGVVLSH